MSSKRKPFDQRREFKHRQKRKPTRDRRLEQLEDRVLLAVDFVPAALGNTQPNREDRALGLDTSNTEPAIALNQNDPGAIAIANGDSLVVSANAGTDFNFAGSFGGLLRPGHTADGSSDLIYTLDGELKWAGLETNQAGTRFVGVTVATNVFL